MDKKKALDYLNSTHNGKKLFAFFDKLEPVDTSFMMGLWKGSEVASGHPMDGLLTLAPWYGKHFKDEETVSPLVMSDRSGKLYSANPDKLLKYAVMFCGIPFRPKNIDPHIFDRFLKLFKTKKYKARVREVTYRGKTSAAMIYDRLAIIDVFRKIDNNTVLGVMDFKGRLHKKGYFFLLERTK